MATRLSDCLVRDGTLRRDVVRLATARQAIYGGTLDTALLELGVLDEPTLWTALATATGAPIPDAAVFENPDPAAARVFDLAWSRRCHAVPVGQLEGALQVCCSEPIDEAQLDAAREALGIGFEVFVVPEVRLAAARQAVYGDPMPPRLLRVLAQLLGAQPVRKWVKALAPDAARAAAAAAAAAAPGQLAEAQLAEAEFDIPVNTYSTEPADIIESRASRAAAEAAAQADSKASPRLKTTPEQEVARALALGDAAPPPNSAQPAELAPRANLRTPIGRSALEALETTDPGNPGQPAQPAGSDANEDQLCRVADDAASEARLAALRLLRTRLARPRVRELADKLRRDLEGPPEHAVVAASALGELRDAQAVPGLIAALDGPPAVARTAARSLVEISQQDFGLHRKKWQSWWDQHKKTDRVAWLLEGLSHRSPEIRFSSSEELRVLTGEYFGYHFDLPKREREEAKERWQTWWYQSQGHSP